MHRSVHGVYHLDVTCNKILLAVGCNCQSCLMTGGQASQNIWPADISATSNSLRMTCKFIGDRSLESTEPTEQTDHHWGHCCIKVKPVPCLSQQFWLWLSNFGSHIIHATHYLTHSSSIFVFLPLAQFVHLSDVRGKKKHVFRGLAKDSKIIVLSVSSSYIIAIMQTCTWRVRY